MSASDDEELSDWKRCSTWLYKCMVLSRDQWESVNCVEHLALCLRDGVLLCLLLNRLHPGAVDLKSFSQRPQMSQFLCLKNIRVFIQSCKKVFSMRDSALFDPSDFYDMPEFHKVISTLSSLSKTKEAKKSGIEPFSVDNDIYIISPCDTIDNEEIYTDHIYGDAAEDADEEVYGQLVDYHPKATARQTPLSHRDYCIKEILDTERNYVDVLTMIIEKFKDPLKNIISNDDSEVIFRHVLQLRMVHRDLLSDLARANCTSPGGRGFSAENTIAGCFVKHKMNLVVYGKYCANLTNAQERHDQCLKAERIRTIIEQKNEEAKVKLRDLLVVPFQRILKYHLLIQTLLKDTDDQSPEKNVLEEALAEMQDLSMYVNEVKRDSENLALISEIENSIVDLNRYMQEGNRLQDYGRRIFDGEVKVKAPKERSFETRYIFLFDKVMVVCRSRGDSYFYKDVIVLSHYNLENHEVTKGMHCFKVVGDPARSDVVGKTYVLGLKTGDQMQRWWNSIEQAKSNVYPDGHDAGDFLFRLCTFEQPTTCDVCKKLLRGVFYQGYRCSNTGMSVHKECIRKASAMKDIKKGEKVKATAPYSGHPPPPNRNHRPLTFEYNDVIVVVSCSGDWIEGRFGDAVGYFPKDKVRVLQSQQGKPSKYEVPTASPVQPKLPPRSGPTQSPVTKSQQSPVVTAPPKEKKTSVSLKTSESSEIGQPWFAGPMSRQAASSALQDKAIGSFLVRFSPEKNEYALSLRYDGDRGDLFRHMRINKDAVSGDYSLAALASFANLVQLVEYYKKHSLEESFPKILTPLTLPYQQGGAAKEVELEPGVVGYCIALYDYSASEVNQLSFSMDDRIAILNKTCGFPLWWRGRLNGRTGYIPSNYVKEIDRN